MFNDILNDVNKKEGKKVNLNILIQPSMKEAFDKLCKGNGITMTAMMIGFIEKSLIDNPNYNNLTQEELEIEELTLEHKIENTQNHLENICSNDYEEEISYSRDIVSLTDNLNFYNRELKKIRNITY